jgi:flavin reductase (DIM6/NTAB) family NADH-FMN oxidoreductase RutF
MAKETIDLRSGLRSLVAFPVVLATVGDNIITLAMVHIFSFNPPLVGIGVAPSRYSYELLKRHREFAVNIPTRHLLGVVSFCGEESGRTCDKFKETGLTADPATRVGAPLISQCPVSLECRLVQEIETGDHTWFIGEVLAAHGDPGYDRSQAIVYWGGEYRVAGEIIGTRS